MHRIHQTDKNTEKNVHVLINTQQPTLLNSWLFPTVFCSHSITFHANWTSFFNPLPCNVLKWSDTCYNMVK